MQEATFLHNYTNATYLPDSTLVFNQKGTGDVSLEKIKEWIWNKLLEYISTKGWFKVGKCIFFGDIFTSSKEPFHAVELVNNYFLLKIQAAVSIYIIQFSGISSELPQFNPLGYNSKSM